MAKQIEYIRKGYSPEEAYELEANAIDKRHTKPLVQALSGLFEIISQKNKELMKLNKDLEKKVAERTKELLKVNEQLKQLSLTDALTGVPNRRHGMQVLQLHWKEDEELSCIMIDADKFKQINDTYGHDAGDVVLIELTRTISHTIRSDDTLCRLGGDEFLVICPNTDLDGAIYIANKIHKKVNELQVPVGEKDGKTGYWYGSISVGVATRTSDMDDVNMLIKAADRSVYLAKEAGRNCVRSIQKND
jgi:hemerythrin